MKWVKPQDRDQLKRELVGLMGESARRQREHIPPQQPPNKEPESTTPESSDPLSWEEEFLTYYEDAAENVSIILLKV